jgi:hypothetical protein
MSNSLSKESTGKRRKNDPDLPKKPLSAYIYF